VIHKSISDINNNLSHLSILEKINKLQSTKSKIEEAKELLYILKAIKNEFSYFEYLDLYIKIKDSISKYKSQLIISINSDLNSGIFKNKVINLLNNNQYKISQQSDTKIILKNNITYSKAYGWFIAKVTTNINVKSNNKIISNNIISSVGRSSSSNQSALVSASNKFNKNLHKLGIDKLLFN